MSISEENELKRQNIIKELKEICPHVELKVNKWTTDLVYYDAYVHRGKIKIMKSTRGIYINDKPEKLAKYKFRTLDLAKQAIEKVLPEAEQKFNQCKKELVKLKKELGFGVSYSYDGDTYGIYDEFLYICFKMDGFEFNFEI